MAGTGKAQATIWATTLLFCLTACAGQAKRDPGTSLAPGVATRGDTVDQLLVAHRMMAAGEYELAIESFHRATLDEGMNAGRKNAPSYSNRHVREQRTSSIRVR